MTASLDWNWLLSVWFNSIGSIFFNEKGLPQIELFVFLFTVPYCAVDISSLLILLYKFNTTFLFTLQTMNLNSPAYFVVNVNTTLRLSLILLSFSKVCHSHPCLNLFPADWPIPSFYWNFWQLLSKSKLIVFDLKVNN